MNSLRPFRTLFVLTSHTALGETGNPTGFWFEELAAPWWALRDAGLYADIATVRGGDPVADPASLSDQGGRTAAVDRFLANAEATRVLAAAPGIAQVDVSRYEAVFLVGGHGTMWDFPGSDVLKNLVEAIVQREGLVAAVCHGPSGLLRVKDAAGAPLVRGRKVCGFANSEEAAVGATQVVPFLLEDQLRQLGAIYQPGAPFEANVVRDGHLLTGQNPQSSQSLGEQLVAAIQQRSGLPEKVHKANRIG